MKLILSLSRNSTTVPFDYQQKLIGVIHRWLGVNELHDKISLYSFSFLLGGTITKNGFDFKNGAKWAISFFEDKYTKQLIASILENPEVICGMYVQDIVIAETSYRENEGLFLLNSPICIKRTDSNRKIKFYTFEDSESGNLMRETLLHKMQEAGLEKDDSLSIEFDLTYAKRKTKLITIHGIKNKCSMCPVFIKGKPETISFALSVGIGNLTGSGFGSIC
ncbi:MAG: CRISPR-associated endoribonuclease Cas6 [Paludibacteraceae bacterium]|nr:CRISPR-associated endoribonuclease Cas6 [Paludibacteraceae bacterium]